MFAFENKVEDLRAIYRSKPGAKHALEYFTTCQPDANVVTVDDLYKFFQHKHYVVPRQDVVNLFKDLDKLGIGEFKIGRRTQKTRFVSKISLATIGFAVADEMEELNHANRELGQTQQKPEKDVEAAQDLRSIKALEIKEASTSSQEVMEKFLNYSFPLRPNVVLSLNLPVDLTNTEAERLAGFIKTLPFNG